jgi:translation initiation factor 2B subunit (eIF-2B alpha/beta/delta family)
MTDGDVVEAFRRSANDRDHGAAEIEVRLLTDLLRLRSRWTPEALSKGAGLLAEGQPAMAPLIALAGKMTTGDAEALESHLEGRLVALKSVPEALAVAALPWIDRAARVVSLSRSSAVAAAVEGAWRSGWSGTVVVLDGSSAGHGAEQAERLGRRGPAVSQPDAAAPRWLDLPETLVAVGADAVGSSRFVNCIGTTALLEMAAARNRSTILIADRSKNVSEEVLEEIVRALPVHREDPGREWPLFETIPLTLVTERISD